MISDWLKTQKKPTRTNQIRDVSKATHWRKIGNKMRRKMAGVFSKQRFGFASEKTIEELKKFPKNPNTVKSTSFWLNAWETWCKPKNTVNKIEENEPEKLNKLLETFYAEVKNKNGDDYEPDSLRVMIAALDRHLNEKGYKFSIIRDREFHSSKQGLEGKARQLRQSGMGKRPNKARSLTEEEEEVLWEAEKFGSKTPEALIYSMWWLLTHFFGLRSYQEHHAMKMEEFQLCRNDEGMEFVQFTEGPTKTRQDGLQNKKRDFQPRMFSVGGERCPVALFKQFVERRPLNMRWSGSFYLSIKRNRRLNDNIWFKTQPMGENTISNMMKTTVAATNLEESHKKFTNHSPRKTTVSKLKKLNVERSDIVKVTGHRNVQSLDDDDEADEEEQRRLSCAISKRNYENPSAEKKRMTVSDITTTVAPLAPVNTNLPVPHTLAGPSMTVSKKKPIPAIIFRFPSSEFLRESNHDEVPGTDHDEHVQQLSSVFHHWPLEASS